MESNGAHLWKVRRSEEVLELVVDDTDHLERLCVGDAAGPKESYVVLLSIVIRVQTCPHTGTHARTHAHAHTHTHTHAHTHR